MNTPLLLEKIPYTFQNQSLLKKALIHPSSTRSQKAKDFERLEFLGDRVLGLLAAQMVYERYPLEKEGDLARRFTALVCREACIEVAHQIGILNHLRVSSGDIATHCAILADAVEALIGAIYLDGGLNAAGAFIKMYWTPLLEKDSRPPKYPKSALQELAQSKSLGSMPVYQVLERSGHDHTPTFTVCVSVKGLGKTVGTGTSKRQAEQAAAKALLEKVKE